MKTRSLRTVWWHDVRLLRLLGQALFLLVLVAVAGFLYANIRTNMARRGLSLGYDFLAVDSGFFIGEGIPFHPKDPYWYAFLVGVVNTLRVALVGIVLATVLGLFMGIARLSSNWLVNKIASAYVEIFRNTPLLVQLFFWYSAVFLMLPRVRESVALPGGIYVSNGGVVLPWFTPAEGFEIWVRWLAIGALLAAIVYALRRRWLKQVDRPGFPILWALPVFIGVAILGWFLSPQAPLKADLPVLGRFRFEGGLHLTTEFSALLLGLVIYTGAFIAEIVRAGILAVDKGQKEAARALGLGSGQVLRLVVLPQALRVIVPPLTSQYLNLTKNSSLAVAIGYPDLFHIAGTILNQSGHAVEMISIIMASYLIMSLTTSLFMNWYNIRVRLVER